MSQVVSRNNPDTFIIVDGINDHDAVTLRGDNGSAHHVTSYESSDFHNYLASRHTDGHVRMGIVRAGARTNVWRVSALYPGADR